MSQNLGEYGKKFQLTDSLLRRLLNQEDYEHIKVIEPAVVVTDESGTKQLKNPGYKHVIVSSKFLYVVNTPAKQDGDLICSIPLEHVKDVCMLYDIPDFLQGDLREQAQHIKITFKVNPTTVAEELLVRTGSLSLLPTHSGTTSNPSSPSMSRRSFQMQENNNNISPINSISGSLLDDKTKRSKSEKNFKNGLVLKNASMTRTTSENKSGIKLKLHSPGSSKTSDILPSRCASGRPLPKPLVGTEKLNASYTNALYLDTLKTDRLSPQLLSPSKSLNNLTEALSTTESKKEVLKSSTTSSMNSDSSLLSMSWNDILKAEQQQQNNNKNEIVRTKARSRSTLDSSDQRSSSLGQSVSAKLFRFFKGSKDSVITDTSSFSNILSPLHSRDPSFSSQDDNIDDQSLLSEDDEFHIEIFTISKTSKLFNVLRESWIFSLIHGTLALQTRNASLHKSFASKKDSSIRIDKDVMIHKFSQLKEEIISCDRDHELFLLTKELKFASDAYIIIKKIAWKSRDLLKFYLANMKRLIDSKDDKFTERMDQFDCLIMIGEFFDDIFQGSEMFTSRNTFLNENSASFVRELLENVILMQPTVRCVSKQSQHQLEKELEELLDTWSDMCVLLLYNLITAASQSTWCCALQQKSFDVTMMVDVLCSNEKTVMNIMDHVMKKLTIALSSDWEYIPSPLHIVYLYKQLTILKFMHENCPNISHYTNTYYHEELKYYIGKTENMKKLSKHYPLTKVVLTSLSQVIHSIVH